MKLQQRQTWHDYTRWPLANEFASVQLELYPSEQDWGGTAWIYGLWTDPEARRQGYAAEVLERAEAIAKQAGHKSVFLEWKQRDTPEAVLDWYIRRGYTERQFSGNGDYYLLEKQLKDIKQQ